MTKTNWLDKNIEKVENETKKKNGWIIFKKYKNYTKYKLKDTGTNKYEYKDSNLQLFTSEFQTELLLNYVFI